MVVAPLNRSRKSNHSCNHDLDGPDPYSADERISQISGSLPITDELCKRFLLFSQRCWCSDSDMVRFALSHAVSCGLMNSPLGTNVVFCCLRYHISIDDFLLVSPRHYLKAYL